MILVEFKDDDGVLHVEPFESLRINHDDAEYEINGSIVDRRQAETLQRLFGNLGNYHSPQYLNANV